MKRIIVIGTLLALGFLGFMSLGEAVQNHLSYSADRVNSYLEANED